MRFASLSGQTVTSAATDRSIAVAPTYLRSCPIEAGTSRISLQLVQGGGSDSLGLCPVELRQLQHFLAAAEHGSLRRAADAAGISQPALTKCIRRLEATLGVALFERHPRGIRLTAPGEALSQHAQSLAAELKLTAETMREMRASARRLVRLGTGPSMAVALLPAVTVRLLAKGAEVQLRIRSGLNDSLLAALQAGEIDFAITTMPARPLSGLLTHERLFTDQVVVFARSDHPLAARTVYPRDLRAARWILPSRNVLTRARLDEFYAERGFGAPDIWIETDSFPYLLKVVAQTDLLSYLPDRLLAGRPLAALDIAGAAWKRPVSLSYWHRRTETPASRLVLSVLREVTREIYGD
ncbi:MAG: LysR family transcriptional regulator [Proteobacteria bacterium]|nr:LysR family transcriptional regulator [Pseudomonadota bacterium]